MLTSLKIDHRIAEHCHERLRLLWRTFPRVQESENDTFTQLFVSTLENCAQFLQSRFRNIHDSCKQLVFRAEELSVARGWRCWVFPADNRGATTRDGMAKVRPRRLFKPLRRGLDKVMRGELTPEIAAMAKLLGSEMQGKLLDEFLQLHGGYGFMSEYKISRAWVDARVARIYGGTSEIMKEIIGRTL